MNLNTYSNRGKYHRIEGIFGLAAFLIPSRTSVGDSFRYLNSP